MASSMLGINLNNTSNTNYKILKKEMRNWREQQSI
jgi:hypothetical protein